MDARFLASMRRWVLPQVLCLSLPCVLGVAGAARAQAPEQTPAELAASKLIQSVTISPVVAFAGADLRVVVRVQPDAGNRRLQLSVDAPTFYASTERQLDGVEGARAHTFNLHELPAGDYEITAVLQGSDGVRTKITRQFKVMGEAPEGQVLDNPRPTTPRGRRGRGSQ
jgi:hypothetical protein